MLTLTLMEGPVYGYSMGGNQITLAPDTEISGNSSMAAIFGVIPLSRELPLN